MKKTRPILTAENYHALGVAMGKIHMRYALLLALGVYTGLRISDLLRLTVSAVSSPRFSLKEGKTGKSRYIFIEPILHGLIQDYIRIHNLEPHHFLFFRHASSKHKPISRQWANTIIRRAAHSVGLCDIGCHSMRKTFACDLYTLTGRIRAVQAELNHRDISTTEIYLEDVLPGFRNSELT